MAQSDGGRGFDRSYKRGAVMGLTVAEVFILLSFCLLLLFTWWQIDTENRSIMAADEFASMTPQEKAAVVEGLSDGTFKLAAALRAEGVNASDPKVVQDLQDYARFMREEDFRRLMEAVVPLDPATRLSLAETVEVTEEAALRAALDSIEGGDTTAERVARTISASAAAQGKMVGLLNENLGERIRAAGGAIDSLGTITMPESVLFEIGKDEVQDPEFLRSFCAVWIETLRQSGVDLSTVRIEGHASSEGKKGQDPEAAWLFNLVLSQNRAKNALKDCIMGLEKPDDRRWASERLAAIGYSSTRLIINPDGTENPEASRRVMFSVEMNQSRLIEQIAKDVAEDIPPMPP